MNSLYIIRVYFVASAPKSVRRRAAHQTPFYEEIAGLTATALKKV